MKITYEIVNHWNVLGMVENRTEVWCIDLCDHRVCSVNELIVEHFFEVLKKAEKEPTRFVFWREVEIETEETDNG